MWVGGPVGQLDYMHFFFSFSVKDNQNGEINA